MVGILKEWTNLCTLDTKLAKEGNCTNSQKNKSYVDQFWKIVIISEEHGNPYEPQTYCLLQCA